MSIDTMKIYHDLIAAGMSELQAKAHVSSLRDVELRIENKARTTYGEMCAYVKELKKEFVSHKLISLYAYIIFLSLALLGGELYYLAHATAEIKSDIKVIKEKLHDRK